VVNIAYERAGARIAVALTLEVVICFSRHQSLPSDLRFYLHLCFYTPTVITFELDLDGPVNSILYRLISVSESPVLCILAFSCRSTRLLLRLRSSLIHTLFFPQRSR